MTVRAVGATRPRWALRISPSSLVDETLPWLVRAFVTAGLIFLVLPTFVVVITSFSGRGVLFPPRTWSFDAYGNIPTSMYDSFVTSVKLGLSAVALALVIALPTSLALVRGALPGKNLLRAALNSPLQVPHIVVGYAFYQYFVLLAGFGVTLRGEFAGLIVGHLLVVTPYVLTTLLGRVASLDPSIEEAAHGLGAGFMRTTFAVTLPLLRPAVLAAVILAFLVSFNEVTVSMFLVGVGNTTLAVQILGSADNELNTMVYAVSALTVLFSVGAALVVNRFIGLRTVLSA